MQEPSAPSAPTAPLFDEPVGANRRAWVWLPVIIVVTFFATAPVVVPIAVLAWLYNVLRFRRTRVRVDADGKVLAQFGNGVEKPIYQLPVATFLNPDGLGPLDGNAYHGTVDSGLQQTHGSRVTQHVRRHLLGGNRRARQRGSHCILRHESRDRVRAEPLTVSSGEQWVEGFAGAFFRPFTHDLHGLRRQRRDPVLATLAEAGDVSTSFQ